MRWRTLSLLLALLAITGCLFASEEPAAPSSADNASSDEATPFPADWAQQAIPEGPDHAHPDPAHHRGLTTPNVRELGWDPLVTDHYNASTGPAYCGSATTQEGRDYAAFTGGSSDVAITVVDVTDPEAPRVAGELVLPNSPVIDVDFVDGTPYVALSTYTVTTADNGSTLASPGIDAQRDTLTPVWRDACGTTYEGPSTPAPKAAGVVLVDLTDVTNPTVEDHVPQPVAGPHNVFADTVDGEPMVVSSVVNFAHSASYFNFYRVEEVPQIGAELVDVGTYSSQAAIDPQDPATHDQPPTSIHVDAWVHQHPVTNETIAYLANWNGGIVVLEYQGPHQLEQRAVWSDYEGPATPEADFFSPYLSEGQMTGQWHRARPVETTWNGSHYTLIHQEVSERPAERPTGVVGILDTTDPSKPVPVAGWTLPVDVNWTEFKHYSPHYLTVQNQTVFVALGHGGVWALDASPEHWPRMPAVGVYTPARESPAPAPDSAANAVGSEPWLGDVQATGSAIVTSDDDGVYSFTLDESIEAPTPEPWNQERWGPIPARGR